MTFSTVTHSAERIAFEWKDGRFLVTDQDVAYILPNDQKEVERLHLNHMLFKHIMNGLHMSPIHEQLEKGIRVLDIGCGPGLWTLDMARLYPNSEFVGVDMADVFLRDNQPSNVTFQVLNAGTGLDYFEDNSFDFVFQRFLVMGFPIEQYIRSVQQMKRILKPNGYIEILELINNYQNAGPAAKNIGTWIDQALVARNMDSFIAEKIPGFLSDAGFCNIETVNYDVPIGDWGGELGKMFLAIQKLALPAVKVMVNELTSVTSEEYEANLAEAWEEFDTMKTSARFKLIYAHA
ncbi:S-adenosyl-L-methionine-dependent methyltransferase [Choanephora cucurbitarum]|nr:S-adenosyl-L-methionine-dependent methyltransferase [Choanephora cucurbitarum]